MKLKVPSRNAFIDNFFALESGKESGDDENPLLRLCVDSWLGC